MGKKNCIGELRWTWMMVQTQISLDVIIAAEFQGESRGERSAAYNPAHLSLDAKSSTHTTSAFIDTHNMNSFTTLNMHTLNKNSFSFFQN